MQIGRNRCEKTIAFVRFLYENNNLIGHHKWNHSCWAIFESFIFSIETPLKSIRFDIDLEWLEIEVNQVIQHLGLTWLTFNALQSSQKTRRQLPGVKALAPKIKQKKSRGRVVYRPYNLSTKMQGSHLLIMLDYYDFLVWLWQARIHKRSPIII